VCPFHHRLPIQVLASKDLKNCIERDCEELAGGEVLITSRMIAGAERGACEDVLLGPLNRKDSKRQREEREWVGVYFKVRKRISRRSRK